jgi:hypothetical protein
MNRGLWIILGGAALLLALLDPVLSAFVPSCLFHRFTGLHCPGCGSTRALQALFTGHPAEAAGANLLVVAAVPVALYLLVRKPDPERLPAWPVITFLAVVILFGILRNIPLYPFVLLAP